MTYRLKPVGCYERERLLRLKSYKLLNGNISVGIPFKGLVIQTKLEGMNLFDKSIYIIDGYPIHGREFRLTMGITY